VAANGSGTATANVTSVSVTCTSGDHVWSLNLSGASSLVPAQLSNLTIPYYTETYTTHSGSVQEPVQVCRSQAIQKNLTDPSSTLSIPVLPTNATDLCHGALKTVLIQSSDSPTTDPVNLPNLGSQILPLYR
jgi:hypothetical protein